MSARDLVPQAAVTPASVASDLLGSIKQIELLLAGSKADIGKIEKRGWWGRLTSSSREDLVTLSSSQNQVNGLMLELIQEVITLNTMSYSFLASVIAELEQRARKGWTDAEGNFQQLSDTGMDFADKARTIFLRIAEGSRDTQRRIDTNTATIGELQLALSRVDEVDAGQDGKIAAIQQRLSEHGQQLGSLDRLLRENAAVDEQQTRSLQAMTARHAEMQGRQEANAVAFAALTARVSQLADQLAGLEAQGVALRAELDREQRAAGELRTHFARKDREREDAQRRLQRLVWGAGAGSAAMATAAAVALSRWL